MLKANFVALLVCVLACGALRTSAEITLLLMANGTSTLVRNETIPAPYLQKFGAPFEPFSANLVLPNATDKSGAVVLLYYVSGLSWERAVRAEMKSNISGVIIVSRGSGNAPGGTDFIFDGSDRSDVRIPAVEIARTGADVILSHLLKNETATVIMRCCEPNVWAIWNASGWMIAYSVIIGGLSTFAFTWALYKIVASAQVRKEKCLNVGTFMMAIIVFANLIRSIIAVVDPIQTRRVIPNPWQYIFLSVTLPISSIALLAITFYWLEILKVSKKVIASPFLSKLFWPYTACGVLILAFELASGACRGLEYDINALTYISAALYVIVNGIEVSLMWFAGYKVLVQLGSSGSSHSSKTDRLIRATRIIMLGGLGVMANIIVIVIIGFSDATLYPVNYSLCFFFGNLFVLWSDICLVAAYRVPDSESKHTSSDTPPNQARQHSQSPRSNSSGD